MAYYSNAGYGERGQGAPHAGAIALRAILAHLMSESVPSTRRDFDHEWIQERLRWQHERMERLAERMESGQ